MSIKDQDDLRALIHTMPGDEWDDKVSHCAAVAGRSKGMVYKWLCGKPPIPHIMLDAIRYRMTSIK